MDVVNRVWYGNKPTEGIGYPLRPDNPKSLITACMQSAGSASAFENDEVFFNNTELSEMNVSCENHVQAQRCAGNAWSSIYSASDL